MSRPRDHYGDRGEPEDLGPGERLAPMTEAELEFSEDYQPEIDTQASRCTVCRHAQEEVIDKHLIEQDLTVKEISKVYGLSTGALSRHKRDCIQGMIQKGREILREQRTAQKLVRTLDKLDGVFDVGRRLLEQTAEDRNVGDSLALMGKLEDNLRLRGELTGELVGANGPRLGAGGEGQIGGPGGPGGQMIRVIMLPTLVGKTQEEIARMTAAKPLEIEGEVVE